MGNKRKQKPKRKPQSSGVRSSRPMSGQETGSVRNDKYAKYAGAVSNKSRRNYADLRLVSPTELAERSAQPPKPVQSAERAPKPQPKQPVKRAKKPQQVKSAERTPKRHPVQSVPRAPKQSVAPPADHAAKRRRPSRRAGRAEQAFAGFGAWIDSLAASVRSARVEKKPSVQPTAPPPARTETTPVDEYSRALNSDDFYGPLVEKYYIKYPEKQEERKSVPGDTAAHSQPVTRREHRLLPKPAPTGEGQKRSIAELAVKNRGSAGRQVVKTGKAKGSISAGTAHRKVRRVNRRRRLFLYAATSMSVVAALLVLFICYGFKVNKIVVAGETPYSAARITGLCDFDKGDNLFFVDVNTSQQQVVDTLPYVEKCEIARAFPNRIEINVTGANVLGVCETATEQWALVSTSGKILECVSDVAVVSGSDMGVTYDPAVHSVEELAAARKLPVLKGLTCTDPKVGGFVDSASVEYLNAFARILESARGLEMDIQSVCHTDRGYEALYENRVNIVLGDTDNADIIQKRMEIADYVFHCEDGVGEHEKGELTYLKNQTYFNPSYDFSEEELERYAKKHADGEDKAIFAADELLKRGAALSKGLRPSAESSAPEDEPVSSDAADEPVMSTVET